MKNVLLRCPYRGSLGYAVVNRNIIFALNEAGVNVYLEPVMWASDNTPLPPEEENILREIESDKYMNVPPYEDVVNMQLVIPDLYNIKMRGLNIGWYIFEANRVPEPWKEKLFMMDALITPTHFNHQQLRQAGYNKPIFILQEGVNPYYYNPTIKPLLPSKKFTFIFVAIAHERKRWKEVISSYLEVFNNEKVRLILKLHPTRDATDIEIKRHIQQERERTGSKAEILLSIKDMAGTLAPLYTSADCYISVSNEGWGLPAMESIACGCSAILLDWGGYTEWFNESFGWKVKVKRIEKVKNMENYSGYEDKSLKWAYPDLDDFKEKLRFVYDHQDIAKRKGELGAKHIIQNYNWRKVVGDFLDVFKYKKVSILATRMPKVSVAMITKNVADFKIDGCNVFKSNLHILSKLANEIIIVDSDSTDDTVKIANEFGCKVYDYRDIQQGCGYCDILTPEDVCPKKERRGKECFSKFRKASFKLCSGDWIFRIDHDELIREEDISLFETIIKKAYFEFYKYFAFNFPTLNFFGKLPYYKAGFDGKFSWFPDFHTRLYRNIPELNEWFAPAHEGVRIPTDSGWIPIINHPQALYLPEPMVYHYGYLKQDNELRNQRYKQLGANTHDLSYKSYYACGIVKYEGNLPKLRYKEEK